MVEYKEVYFNQSDWSSTVTLFCLHTRMVCPVPPESGFSGFT